MLVTKSDLEEKMAKVTELANKVDELTMQNEYAIKLKDIGFAEEKKGTCGPQQLPAVGVPCLSFLLSCHPSPCSPSDRRRWVPCL